MAEAPRFNAYFKKQEGLSVLEMNRNDWEALKIDSTSPKELAKELMSIRPDIPIILCTGFSDQIDEKRAKEMGISAFVMKPIVMRQMANTIREVLDKK